MAEQVHWSGSMGYFTGKAIWTHVVRETTDGRKRAKSVVAVLSCHEKMSYCGAHGRCAK